MHNVTESHIVHHQDNASQQDAMVHGIRWWWWNSATDQDTNKDNSRRRTRFWKLPASTLSHIVYLHNRHTLWTLDSEMSEKRKARQNKSTKQNSITCRQIHLYFTYAHRRDKDEWKRPLERRISTLEDTSFLSHVSNRYTTTPCLFPWCISFSSGVPSRVNRMGPSGVPSIRCKGIRGIYSFPITSQHRRRRRFFRHFFPISQIMERKETLEPFLLRIRAHWQRTVLLVDEHDGDWNA